MVNDGRSYFEAAASVVSKREPMEGQYACPCCGIFSFGEAGGYEICDSCGWEDDPAQEANPTMAGGANNHSLIEAKNYFKLHGWSEPKPKLPNLPG
jgi:Cysteine-rich CPCC